MLEERLLFQVAQFLRRGRKALSKKPNHGLNKGSESHALVKSLVAIILFSLCLWAAQWQFHRGIDRQARNNAIEANSQKSVSALDSVIGNIEKHEWQPISVSGSFDGSQQILLRNRYFEGVYGFEVLTLFTSSDEKTFWVDRGWVKAGKDAQTAPAVSEVPSGNVTITGRVRLESSLPRGSFFALPHDKNSGLISQANAQSHLSTEKFYLDLISGDNPDLTPKVPAELPELSDGPHLAYALQWLFFAGLVVYGRFLIRRDVLAKKEL